MEDDLSQWKQKYLDAVTEIQRLTSVIETLQRQLQESIKSNDEQRKTLTELETKIDKLIAQTKRRNKRDYGKKTENHNPRPAVTPQQKAKSCRRSG
jgi:peptidoglycan hydrolase CwlO-like protein